MKYSKLGLLGIIMLIFVCEWLFLNRNYLPSLSVDGIQGLTSLTSSYAGYNYIGSHGTFYTLLFLSLLIQYISEDKVQLLVRIKRKSFLLLNYKRVLFCACCFSVLFSLVNVVFVTVFEDHTLLMDSRFYIGSIISMILYIIFYFFVGSIFLLIETIISSKNMALLATFGLMTVWTFVTRYISIWTPVENLVVFDYLFNNQLDLVKVGIHILELGVVIGAIVTITIINFKDKDVLNEKS